MTMFKKTALALALCSAVTATSAIAASDGEDPGYWSMWGMRNMGTMKMMDTNGDHKVTKAEYMKYMEKSFDTLDKNKDGTITLEEWLGMQLN
jgi:hypothetical protein